MLKSWNDIEGYNFYKVPEQSYYRLDDKFPNPICYTLEGDFIGDGADFLEHIRKRYNKSDNYSSELTRNRTKMNEEENEDRMRKMTDVEPLGTKINNFLEKAKQKNFQ